MRAFIIRPFGNKDGIDFDAVENQLIAPALEALEITGRTTIEILKQGNIRVDMFQRLLTADLVIADVSIHNANVFYELGIRHALRSKWTFLLRCRGDSFPFDLQTDRYFLYDKEQPASSRDLLIQALRQTVASQDQDSPVFDLLPGLAAQDPARFLPVPRDFQENVEYAFANKQFGDLELLAEEVQGLEWEVSGLRVVGRAQFRAKAHEGAQDTWEAVRKADQLDVEANTLLATIYQRLGDLTKSDQAVRRVLEHHELNSYTRAEVHALIGRNAKARWMASWEEEPIDKQGEQALHSQYLEESLDSYSEAFREDLNHFYSGLNALAMLTVLTELAAAWPQVWEDRFEDPEDALLVLNRHREHRNRLATGVDLSIKAALDRLKQQKKSDIWVQISQADLLCLTSKRPARVADSYRRALAEATDFEIDSVQKQLLMYKNLGVSFVNVQAALSEPPLKPIASKEEQNKSTLSPEKAGRVLLFTGHMIDKPDRPKPRFPAAKEGVARQSIQEAILKENEAAGGIAFGIAGGASGGDILFHEVCQEQNIPTRLFLALPKDQYIAASVSPAGADWVERFIRLTQELEEKQSADPQTSAAFVRILQDSRALPSWLQEKPNYTVWQRNNLWTLHNALAEGGQSVTLIALWNGEEGDGPGGTGDLVEKAQKRGAKTVILNTNELFKI